MRIITPSIEERPNSLNFAPKNPIRSTVDGAVKGFLIISWCLSGCSEHASTISELRNSIAGFVGSIFKLWYPFFNIREYAYHAPIVTTDHTLLVWEYPRCAHVFVANRAFHRHRTPFLSLCFMLFVLLQLLASIRIYTLAIPALIENLFSSTRNWETSGERSVMQSG